MKPQIVLVVTDKDKNADIAKHKVQMLELRIDLFKNKDVSYAVEQFKLRRKLKIPLLLTIRNQKKEGAVKEFPDQVKWTLLEKLVPLCDWVDIELSSKLCAKTIKLARAHKKKVMISAHDFKKTPKNLNELLKKGLSTRADLVKIAAQANTPQDFFTMLEFTQKNNKHALATMCLGKWGGLSRVILPSVGSRLVYTFLNKPTAPGQIDVKTLITALNSLN
jgi:3-dehydroquinate dehydratase I